MAVTHTCVLSQRCSPPTHPLPFAIVRASYYVFISPENFGKNESALPPGKKKKKKEKNNTAILLKGVCSCMQKKKKI